MIRTDTRWDEQRRDANGTRPALTVCMAKTLAIIATVADMRCTSCEHLVHRTTSKFLGTRHGSCAAWQWFVVWPDCPPPPVPERSHAGEWCRKFEPIRGNSNEPGKSNPQ